MAEVVESDLVAVGLVRLQRDMLLYAPMMDTAFRSTCNKRNSKDAEPNNSYIRINDSVKTTNEADSEIGLITPFTNLLHAGE